MSPGPITLLYATVSGTAERLAAEAAGRLAAAGWRPRVADLAEFPPADLAGLDLALFFISTWGEGEPPPAAAGFCAAVGDPSGPALGRLRYAVLALGSSRYPDFCAGGRRLDADLARRGARRLVPRGECDVQFKAAFEAWWEQVRAALAAEP